MEKKDQRDKMAYYEDRDRRREKWESEQEKKNLDNKI